MKKLFVYISSPYTLPEGKQTENVINSFCYFSELLKLGFVPIAPLTAHYINIHFPHSWEAWIDYDLEIISRCDCVLRVQGESKGADIEVEFAKEKNIPIFYTIHDLIHYKKRKENGAIGIENCK